MYSRPPSHSPNTFRKKKMFLLRFPSSTKASGQTRLIRVVFVNQVSGVLDEHKQYFGSLWEPEELACRRAPVRASRSPSERARTRRSAWSARSYGLPEICRNFGRTSKPQPRYGASRVGNGSRCDPEPPGANSSPAGWSQAMPNVVMAFVRSSTAAGWTAADFNLPSNRKRKEAV